MNNTYKVSINNETEMNIDQASVEALDLSQVSPNKYHLLKDHQSIHASIVEKNFLNKTYKVKVNSTVYEVQISNPLDLLIEQMGLGVVSNLQVNEVKAPMPGLLLEVNVSIGDEVKEGQTLLILEAMKMENSLTSPRNGTIKNIAIEKGSTVAKNDLLIEFE